MGEDGGVHEIGFLDMVSEELHLMEIFGKPVMGTGVIRCLLDV